MPRLIATDFDMLQEKTRACFLVKSECEVALTYLNYSKLEEESFTKLKDKLSLYKSSVQTCHKFIFFFSNYNYDFTLSTSDFKKCPHFV